MPKKKIEPIVEKPLLDEVVQDKGERKLSWEKFLEKAKAQNPVKFAEKEARGDFKKIPEDFR